MRYLTILGLLALACMLCATPGLAQSIPPGSYQQTCTDINVVNGATLAARCQDTSGNWRSTRLTNIQDCSGEIVNDNGSLRCGKGGNYYNNTGYNGGYQGGYYPGGYQNGLPPGDYVQTCRNIRSDGNVLVAECQKRDGGWRRTSLDLGQCSGGIVNNNGNLTCGGGNGYSNGGYNGGYNNGGYNNGYGYGGYQNGLPAGDYVQTCRNMRMDGNRLLAECQKRDGGWRRTSLDASSCSSPIANDNGRLVCGQGGGYGYGGYPGGYSGGYQGSIPPGSYTQTCRNIRTRGDRLDAECQTRDGNWRHTSLDDIDRCGSAIANDDGRLVCGR